MEEEEEISVESTKSRNNKFCSLLKKRLPILSWLPKYDFQRDLTNDLAAGLTVAVMHIPQGMAYGLLASVPPVAGLYTAIFPVIVYVAMGTSRHNSFGTFAVVSLLVSRAVEARHDSDPMQTATALTLLVGILQVLFGLVHMDKLVCLLLSRPLINGFSTGAAVHVFSSQIKFVLGLEKLAPKITGPFRIILFYASLLPLVGETNLTCLLMALITCLLLVLYNSCLDRHLDNLLGFQVPIQLIVMALSIVIVSILQLNLPPHSLQVVGIVPTGLPSFKFPVLELSLLLDALVTSVVAYVISHSLGSLLAEKHRYQIDARQEWFAQGCANLVGSCFQSLPVSASLSRTMVQDDAGCRTLMTSAFSVILLLLVLLFAGPLLHNLPLTVLASIILVSLSGIFSSLAKLPEMWRKERHNAVIWIVAFLATVIVDVDYGLIIACFANIFVMYWRRKKAKIAQSQDFRSDQEATRHLEEEEEEEEGTTKI